MLFENENENLNIYNQQLRGKNKQTRPNPRIDFLHAPFLWAGKPNSARQENRKPSKRAKPRFSQYRAGAYKADPAFPLFPSSAGILGVKPNF